MDTIASKKSKKPNCSNKETEVLLEERQDQIGTESLRVSSVGGGGGRRVEYPVKREGGGGGTGVEESDSGGGGGGGGGARGDSALATPWMVVGGWAGRKGGVGGRVGYSSREGQPPQDALTWTMDMPAPTLPRLVLLLALLAAAPPVTRARASRPGPGVVSSSWGASSHPPHHLAHPSRARPQPPLQWQWWDLLNYPPTLPSSPWKSLTQPGSPSLPGHTRMGTVEEDGSVLKNPGLLPGQTATGIYYNPVNNRIPAPSLSKKLISRRFRPSSRWRRSFEEEEKKNTPKRLPIINRIHKNRPENIRRLNGLHYHHTVQREEAGKGLSSGDPGQLTPDHSHNSNQDTDSTDVDLTLTLPSSLIQPLLTSLPLTKRHQTGAKTSSASPKVEIVGLRIQDADDTNTTVVLSLRDHRSNEDKEKEEEGWDREGNKEVETEENQHQRGPHSRAKRFARRRISYGMNSRIRAQMLAHRLSISYRHVQPCSYKDRYYCMNGGTCVFVGALDIKTCR
ncbi:hypothetical protein ACOMHN_002199 [Nucella lapillus]